jgi:hypothetical protein
VKLKPILRPVDWASIPPQSCMLGRFWTFVSTIDTNNAVVGNSPLDVYCRSATKRARLQPWLGHNLTSFDYWLTEYRFGLNNFALAEA